MFVYLVVSYKNALIMNFFFISRLSTLRNYILVFLRILSGFAFLFLFWLGSIIDNSMHTLTTISFY